MTKIITKTCIFQIVEYNNIAPIRIMWYFEKRCSFISKNNKQTWKN